MGRGPPACFIGAQQRLMRSVCLYSPAWAFGDPGLVLPRPWPGDGLVGALLEQWLTSPVSCQLEPRELLQCSTSLVTVHSAQCTVQTTQCTLHSAVYTVHSAQCSTGYRRRTCATMFTCVTVTDSGPDPLPFTNTRHLTPSTPDCHQYWPLAPTNI